MLIRSHGTKVEKLITQIWLSLTNWDFWTCDRIKNWPLLTRALTARFKYKLNKKFRIRLIWRWGTSIQNLSPIRWLWKKKLNRQPLKGSEPITGNLFLDWLEVTWGFINEFCQNNLIKVYKLFINLCNEISMSAKTLTV